MHHLARAMHCSSVPILNLSKVFLPIAAALALRPTLTVVLGGLEYWVLLEMLSRRFVLFQHLD